MQSYMMKQRISIFLLFTILLSANGYAQKGIMRLTQQTLMHEVRETPSPLDGQHINVHLVHIDRNMSKCLYSVRVE